MVTRPAMFTIRVTPEERQLIAQIAEHEERTPSDTARRLLLAKARELGIMPAATEENQHDEVRAT